jgi:hypothetical protein
LDERVRPWRGTFLYVRDAPVTLAPQAARGFNAQRLRTQKELGGEVGGMAAAICK